MVSETLAQNPWLMYAHPHACTAPMRECAALHTQGESLRVLAMRCAHRAPCLWDDTLCSGMYGGGPAGDDQRSAL